MPGSETSNGRRKWMGDVKIGAFNPAEQTNLQNIRPYEAPIMFKDVTPFFVVKVQK